MTNNTAQAADNPTLTPGALAALKHAGFSRRLFLQGAGALIVSFSGGALLTVRAQGPETADAAAPSPMQLDSWLAIAADGGVTAYTGKEELGQGISTAQIQLVAEELCVPFSRVQLIYCDTAMTPDQGVTSGSQSHPANFNHSNLAQAAATAREALLALAAKRLAVPVDQLTVVGGLITAPHDSSKKCELWPVGRRQEV